MNLLLPTSGQQRGKEQHMWGNMTHNRKDMKGRRKSEYKTATPAPLLERLHFYNSFQRSYISPRERSYISPREFVHSKILLINNGFIK